MVVDGGKGKSRKIRFSSSRLFRVFFITAVALLVPTLLMVPAAISEGQRYYGGPYLVAQQLADKPQNFFSLNSPDPYMLQVLSNPGHDVHLNGTEFAQADEMITAYGTRDVEFGGSYYRISIGIDLVDYGPSVSSFLPPIIMAWSLWGLLVAIAAIGLRVAKSRKSTVSAQ